MPRVWGFTRDPGDSAAFASVARQGRRRLDGHSRALPEAGVLIDAVADMQNELRRGSGNAFAMRNLVERPLQFWMFVDVLANLRHRLAGRLETFFEFGLGFDLRLAQRHLHSAVGIHFAFAGGFNGQEDHVFELVDDSRLHAIRLWRGHTSEW